MCCDCIIKIFIKNNVSSSVAPASDIDCDTNCGWMTGCVLDINAHNRIFSAHSLRSKTDLVDSILKQVSPSWLHARSHCGNRSDALVLSWKVSAAVSTDVATPTPTNKWRTCVQTISCHNIHNEFGNTLITFTWH